MKKNKVQNKVRHPPIAEVYTLTEFSQIQSDSKDPNLRFQYSAAISMLTMKDSAFNRVHKDILYRQTK